MTINNTTGPAARHNARYYALQAIYQWQLSDANLSDIEFQFLNEHIEKKIELDYFKELLHKVPQQIDEINEAITPFLNRSMKEVDPVEIAVLRIATYELISRPDIPYRVIINEALELTKTFGSVEGFKFVNGILDRVAKKLRATEIAIPKQDK